MVCQLILYGTSACHLCEQAEALIITSLAGQDPGNYQLAKVDIVGEPALEDKYALRIPVLERMDTGDALDWPFNQEKLWNFLRGET